MLILAIDTTGFSASLAVVKDGKDVLFHKTGSGFVPKKKWDDFPRLLPEHHQKFLIHNLKKINWKKVDAIAVSAYSGIYNCVLVGLSNAKILSARRKKPLIRVDHILAHIYSTWLERNPDNFQFPILVFSASGSHSGFFLLTGRSRCEVIYDAVPKQNKEGVEVFVGVGKVFYEMGKKLGILGPSDSNIKKLLEIAPRGNSRKFDFVKYYHGLILDLNFSDFMLSIERIFEKEAGREFNRKRLIADIAAGFRKSITEVLIDKILTLAKIKKAAEIHIAGGISEDKYIQSRLKEEIKKAKSPFILRYPLKKYYRLDNAAMVGALAYYQRKHRIRFIGFKSKITY
jgi:N6-L-threonylcarbamoyladenine synthase